MVDEYIKETVMAISVIDKGFNDEVKCGHCGSKLKFELGDVAFKKVQPMDIDDDDEGYTITCPSCGHAVNVSSNVRGAARTRVKELHKAREQSDMDV
jgi:DNA-directed RNA polymerase subunit RPC12/RpoP